MAIPTMAAWIIGAAAVAGAATAGGVVLYTSGPFANDEGPPAQAGPTETAIAEASPSPTAAPADSTLDASEPFDPATLPPVDTTDWVTHTGPRGELTIRTPASWTVKTSEQTDFSGETVIGDSIKVLSLANPPATPGSFSPSPGDVWADLATELEPVTYSSGIDDAGQFNQVQFTREIGGQPSEILATQFLNPPGFPPGVGELTFFASVPTPRGGYLIAAVHVALPADLKTVAEAQALLTEVILK